jgi:hypothetical protein
MLCPVRRPEEELTNRISPSLLPPPHTEQFIHGSHQAMKSESQEARNPRKPWSQGAKEPNARTVARHGSLRQTLPQTKCCATRCGLAGELKLRRRGEDGRGPRPEKPAMSLRIWPRRGSSWLVVARRALWRHCVFNNCGCEMTDGSMVLVNHRRPLIGIGPLQPSRRTGGKERLDPS